MMPDSDSNSPEQKKHICVWILLFIRHRLLNLCYEDGALIY